MLWRNASPIDWIVSSAKTGQLNFNLLRIRNPILHQFQPLYTFVKLFKCMHQCFLSLKESWVKEEEHPKHPQLHSLVGLVHVQIPEELGLDQLFCFLGIAPCLAPSKWQFYGTVIELHRFDFSPIEYTALQWNQTSACYKSAIKANASHMALTNASPRGGVHHQHGSSESNWERNKAN